MCGADRETGGVSIRSVPAAWAIRASARELDVQYLLGHSTPVMARRYSATYSSEEAVAHHAQFSPVGRLELPVT